MIQFDPRALVESLSLLTADLRAGGDGAATVVGIQSGALQVHVAQGVSDYDTGTPAQSDQTFEIGSQTKMMTAVLILQLMEQGKIDLDAAAADYLPADTVAGLANADTATVRQLLNMTSGIGNYTEAVNADGLPLFIEYLLDNPDSIFGPEQALEIARDMDPTSAPGESYYYSNTNYALLGQIIERVTGQSFIDALQSRIFDPAGMVASGRQLETDDPRLHSYAVNPLTGDLIDVTRTLWEMRGEAGVAATTSDMIAFVQALLVDRSLLGPGAMAQMTEFLTNDRGPGFAIGFGLGLVQAVVKGVGTYQGFTGGTLATESSTFLDLDNGMIVAIGSTTVLPAGLGGLEIAIAVGELPLWQAVVDDGGPVFVASGSAAQMRLTKDDGGLRLALGGAALVLDRDLAGLATDSLIFADGSVVVVGDHGGDWLKIGTAARGTDNHLMGLAGDDTLRGAAGDDWLQGGTGRDVLRGGAGDDVLRGGARADTFVFRAGDSGHDVLRDFKVRQDRIDLTGLGPVTLTLHNGDTVLTNGDLTLILQGISEPDLAALVF